VRHFFNNTLIKDGFVEKDHGVAHYETEEHAVKDTHSCVEEEKENSTEHDCSSNKVSFPGFSTPLPSR
jgi:hypothetical protein